MELTYNRYRVYLNGKDIPATDITITAEADSPSTATFVLHPTASAFKIPLRTVVQITAQTDYYKATPSKPEIRPDQLIEFIIFEGEILQRSYMKTGTRWSIQYSAADFRGVFNYPIKYFIDFSTLNLALPGGPDLKAIIEGIPFTAAGAIGWNMWLKSVIEKAGGDLTKLLKSFITGAKNIYYDNFVKTRKISQRLYTYTGSTLAGELQNKAIQDLIFAQFQSLNCVAVSISDIINCFQQSGIGIKLYLFSTNLCPPPPSSSAVNQYFIVPTLVGVAPPKCNVFTQDIVGTIQTTEKLTPTRITMAVQSFLTPGTLERVDTYYHLGPEEFRNLVKATKGKKEYEHMSYEEISVKLQTEEESKYGVRSLIQEVPVGASRDNTTLGQLADYAYRVYKYADYTIALNNCPFNPFPVVGLPALVYLRNGPVGIGILRQISHNLSDRASSSNFIISNFVPKDDLGEVPSTLSDFGLSKINSVYMNMLGQTSISVLGQDDTQAVVDDFVSLADIVSKREDPVKYWMTYAKRDLMTISQAYKLMYSDLPTALSSDAEKIVSAYAYECRLLGGSPNG